jgi:hypothetical protein
VPCRIVKRVDCLSRDICQGIFCRTFYRKPFYICPSLYDKYERSTTNNPTTMAASLISFLIANPVTAPNGNPRQAKKIISHHK